jgi:hypothetical protein
MNSNYKLIKIELSTILRYYEAPGDTFIEINKLEILLNSIIVYTKYFSLVIRAHFRIELEHLNSSNYSEMYLYIHSIRDDLYSFKLYSKEGGDHIIIFNAMDYLLNDCISLKAVVSVEKFLTKYSIYMISELTDRRMKSMQF